MRLTRPRPFGLTRTPRRSALVIATFLLTHACGGGDGTTEPPSPAGISPAARAYLEQLIGIMQANSINRLTIDWPALRTNVFAAAPRAQTSVETYPAITEALRLLGDGHSSYRTPTGSVLFVPKRTCQASGGGSPPLPANIGYVRVTSFSGTAAQATAFANSIQDAIRAADHDSLIGWIVDLRGNGGGNMWPMIAGVGPVLGEGLIGYFIDPAGVETFWEYRNGASWVSGVMQQSVATPYRLKRELPKVAVLSDNGIASSGEATLIAFRQRPNTRSFGAATCGLSTANRGFTIDDGSLLNLTVAVMADRTKTKYGDTIAPDEVFADPTQAVQRAIVWLQSPN